MSTSTTTNTSLLTQAENTLETIGSEILSGAQQIALILETQLSQLSSEEVAACNPAIQTFFTFLQQNPTAINNPATLTPALVSLEASLLAAQVTVESQIIKSIASALSSAFTGWAALTPTSTAAAAPTA